MTVYAERVKEVRRTSDTGGTEITETSTTSSDGQATVVRIVWYVSGILQALLAIRFLLALLGANPANAFADFIYNVSYPFVAPFFGLFSYNLNYGAAHFELYTLVAMLVYALIAYGIVRLITINRPAATTY